jgi:uncharacterized protein (TIGR00290 family)
MKAFIYWSGGKDAAMAYEICKRLYNKLPQLLVNRVTNAGIVAAHEIKSSLITAQANTMGVALQTVIIPAFAPNNVYENILAAQLTTLKAQGYTHAVFGDIFLDDLKNYHTTFHKKMGFECLFPLWGRDTKQLGNEIIEAGIQPIVTAVNTKYLPASLAGSLYNKKFIEQLPDGVDVCGENGEFHTFVYNAQFYKYPLAVNMQEGTETVAYHAGTDYETTMAYVPMQLGEGL